LFVTSENVGSYELIWKKKKYVESKFNEIEPRSILKRNDLLMNIVGGSIGRTAIYDIDELANINQAVTIIRLLPMVSFDYFLHFFNSPTCIAYMYDKQVENARPNLSMGNISKFLIPFPSLEEQKAIVQQVNALMALCDKLETEIATRTTTLEDWMKSWVGGL
jgi:type I restriction enzyme S subunit